MLYFPQMVQQSKSHSGFSVHSPLDSPMMMQQPLLTHTHTHTHTIRARNILKSLVALWAGILVILVARNELD